METVEEIATVVSSIVGALIVNGCVILVVLFWMQP